MIRRTVRIGLALGLLGGLVFALVKVLGARQHAAVDAVPVPAEPWPPLREEPAPIARVADAAPAAAWVEPAGLVCPTSHPVKAKLASKIFHLPGMRYYERTKPDRCYRDADAAAADGLRPAKQ